MESSAYKQEHYCSNKNKQGKRTMKKLILFTLFALMFSLSSCAYAMSPNTEIASVSQTKQAIVTVGVEKSTVAANDRFSPAYADVVQNSASDNSVNANQTETISTSKYTNQIIRIDYDIAFSPPDLTADRNQLNKRSLGSFNKTKPFVQRE
jgi:hypothetical protein